MQYDFKFKVQCISLISKCIISVSPITQKGHSNPDIYDEFISSVTDESLVDETRVCHKYIILILVSLMSLFITTGSMPLLVEIFFPRVSPAQ